eukprot:1562618-Amphidinium_carterae.1
MPRIPFARVYDSGNTCWSLPWQRAQCKTRPTCTSFSLSKSSLKAWQYKRQSNAALKQWHRHNARYVCAPQQQRVCT